MLSHVPARSEIRFLEYRLEVVSLWPPSPRKTATSEAIARRLTAIARSALARPGVDDLMDSSCRLLDYAFSPARE
jgi:hypothetical protein